MSDVYGGPPLFEGDADDVIEMAVQEMGQRLTDPDRRADVPDHVLIKFVAEGNKMQERRAAEKARLEAQTATKDEIEVIVTSDLPSERKRKLLEEALAKLEKRIARLRQLLEQGDFR